MAGYKAVEIRGVNVIRCPASVKVEDPKEFAVLIKTWQLSPANVHVLDMRDVIELDPAIYRTLAPYAQSLRANGKVLFIISASPEIQKQLSRDGVDTMFTSIGSLDDAAKLATKLAEMNQAQIGNEIRDYFISALTRTIERKLAIRVNASKSRMRQAVEPSGNVAGMLQVSLAGTKYALFVGMTTDVFMKIHALLETDKAAQANPSVEATLSILLDGLFDQLMDPGFQDSSGHVATLQGLAVEVLIGAKLKAHPLREKMNLQVPFDTALGPLLLDLVRM